ncbi:biopolymer transporter ExbD [bacterium]|jgi:biopolymer transport protein ExbD|nr:biopolymer transporter ExbD [bacterium]
MSAGVSSGSGARGDTSQDFELNIASIIDCFTVLITFMLASASFISIGVLDAGISAGGSTANAAKPPSVTLSILLKPDKDIEVKISGKTNLTVKLPAKNKDWDFDALTAHLAADKAKWSDLAGVTLTAENDVQYKEVVRSMETIRKTFPAVLLGGF